MVLGKYTVIHPEIMVINAQIYHLNDVDKCPFRCGTII